MDRCFRLLVSMLLVCLLVVPPGLAYSESGNTTKDGHEDHGAGAGTGGHHDPEATAYDDPCRPAWERLDERMKQLDQKYARAHAGLDAEADRFYAENHTDEERAAFERDQQAQREDLHHQEEAERDEAHRIFDQECQAAMKEAGHHDDRPYDGAEYAERPEPAEPYHDEPHQDPPEWVSEECRALIEEFDQVQRDRMDTFHEEMQAKWEAFEARMRDRWDAFWDEGNHTDEEVQAFEREMEAEREAFRDKMHAEEEALRHEEEAMFERHREKIESTCQPPEPMRPAMDGHAGEVPAELEALHRECEEKFQRLEAAFRAEMEALESSWRDSEEGDDAAFHQKMRAKEAAFEAELRSTMRACEEKARALWDEKMAVDADEEMMDRMGSWSVSESGGKVLLTGNYVSLVGDPTTSTMGRIAVGGETFIAKLDTLGRLEFFDMEEATDGDSALTATGESIRVRIHDNPGGVINFKADEAHAFVLTLPPSIEVSPRNNGWALQGAGGAAFVRVAPGSSEWSEGDRTLKVWGESTFLVKDRSDNKVLPAVANKHRDDLVQAVEDRRLGAEVTVAKGGDGKAVDEAVVYDGDVEVEVETSDDAKEAPVTVTVSSDTLEEGRTFVVNVDQSVLRGNVQVAYFDVDEVTGEESPADIRKASSLSDILDADDDEGAEYWIVEDEDGLQVLVSVPHWSVHRFRIESGPDAGMELALPGPVALLVGIGALAVAGHQMRRRD